MIAAFESVVDTFEKKYRRRREIRVCDSQNLQARPTWVCYPKYGLASSCLISNYHHVLKYQLPPNVPSQERQTLANSSSSLALIMSRKGVGLAAFDRSRLTSAQYASHGNNLRTSHSTSLATQLSVFRSLLQQFAQTHAKDIRSNPSFRAEFARMCSAIGVDPLTSSSGAGSKDGGGSFWAQLLGGSVNDFYFDLAVKVVEVCGATREENGGLIGVKELKDRIMRTRIEGSAEVTE